MSKIPIIQTLKELEGNPRLCIITEPLWIIPFNLYTPFVSVYMAALFMTDRQIGLVASVFMLFRALAAFFGGAITDKLGRKLTTFIFDMLSWSVPCLLWAFSQNFWWFIVAASFNGLMQITDNSWTCLLVEDVKKGSMVKVYSLLHMIGQLAVIFAPLAALLVGKLTVEPAMRILYMITFVSMTVKFVILYIYCDETEVGRTRMRETAGMSLWKIMSGYGEIFKRIFSSRAMILALLLTTIFNIIWMVSGSFFGLYVTGTLRIPEHFLAYFPILRSLVIAFFLIFVQPKLERFGFRYPMLIGLFVYLISISILIFTPIEALYVLVLSIFLDAVAFSLVVPRNDSLTQLLIDPAERARIRGLMMVVVLGITIPFGYFAGWLSDMDRRFPFVLCAFFIVLLVGIIAASKKRLEAMRKANEV
ncbi:MAG: MFS transporter [Oscillospiraceae bacterium]|nr:MFS transporter [Oscillospiraceae bacterium]